MPYKAKGKCVYKKDTGAKVGCTKGSVKDYLAALYMHADESVQEEEKLVGGEADDMSAKDIAKKNNVSTDSIKKQIRKGVDSEKKEHGGTEEEDKEMAKDHLAKHPNYYKNSNKIEKAASKGEKVNEDKIKGGKADNMTPAGIAKLHKVSLDKIETQLKKGIKIELEHVDTEAEAKEIAMDHLVEMPDYYNRLNKMEKTASKEEKTVDITESTKSLIKRIIRENLGLKKDKFKQLALANKYTAPKIPTGNIFAHQPVNINAIRQDADNLIDGNEFESLPVESVNVYDIYPTQKFVTIDNLKSTQNVGPETKAYLLCDKGKYYILDGHHRIANNILDGNEIITAHVYHTK